MRRAMMATVCAALLAGPAAAQDARSELSETYEKNRQALHELVGGLSEAQWNWRSAPDRWSIVEIVEHLTLNEQLVGEIVHGELEEMPTSSEATAQAEVLEAQVATTLRDRSQKFQAPEFVQPTGRWTGGEEVMSWFDTARDDMLAFFEKDDWDLRSRGAMHPVLQTEVDAHGWAVFTVEHAKRHMEQIHEVMTSEGFPSM